jgi:hypothetical protein
MLACLDKGEPREKLSAESLWKFDANPSNRNYTSVAEEAVFVFSRQIGIVYHKSDHLLWMPRK